MREFSVSLVDLPKTGTSQTFRCTPGASRTGVRYTTTFIGSRVVGDRHKAVGS